MEKLSWLEKVQQTQMVAHLLLVNW